VNVTHTSSILGLLSLLFITACFEVPATLKFPDASADAYDAAPTDVGPTDVGPADVGPPPSDGGLSAPDDSVIRDAATGEEDVGPGSNTGTPAQPLVLWDLEQTGASETPLESTGRLVGYDLELLSGSDLQYRQGVTFGEPHGMAYVTGPTATLAEMIQTSGTFTVVMWFSTGGEAQPRAEGAAIPARIFSWSYDHTLRNLTIGQAGHNLQVRLRLAPLPDEDRQAWRNGLIQRTNGDDEPVQLPPLVSRDDRLATDGRVHVALRFNEASQLSIWVNGSRYDANEEYGAELAQGISNWDRSYGMCFGNEFAQGANQPSPEDGDYRPWYGTIHGFALYDRALSEAEIFESLARRTNPP